MSSLHDGSLIKLLLFLLQNSRCLYHMVASPGKRVHLTFFLFDVSINVNKLYLYNNLKTFLIMIVDYEPLSSFSPLTIFCALKMGNSI